MNIGAIWGFSYKKVLITYIGLFLISSITEFLFTNSFFYSFIISYIGIFFIAPYINRALNEFFRNFHVKKVVRNLVISWLLFGIIFLYVHLFFLTDYLTRGEEYLGINPLSQFSFNFLDYLDNPHFLHKYVANEFIRRKVFQSIYVIGILDIEIG